MQCFAYYRIRLSPRLFIVAGYGFVDFEKASEADRAVQNLQQQGIQAQMAKVRESSVSIPLSTRVTTHLFLDVQFKRIWTKLLLNLSFNFI